MTVTLKYEAFAICEEVGLVFVQGGPLGRFLPKFTAAATVADLPGFRRPRGFCFSFHILGVVGMHHYDGVHSY